MTTFQICVVAFAAILTVLGGRAFYDFQRESESVLVALFITVFLTPLLLPIYTWMGIAVTYLFIFNKEARGYMLHDLGLKKGGLS